MMDNLEIPSGLKKRGEEEGTVASCYIDSINPFGYYILAPSVVVYERRRKKTCSPLQLFRHRSSTGADPAV